MILNRKNINALWTDRLNGRPVRIFQPRVDINGLPNAKMLSIKLTQKYTRIDFEFQLEASGIRVPDFTISPKIKIITPADRSTYTAEKDHFLIHSENAPIAPKKFRPKSEDDRLYFTLFFEPLPMYTLDFDMVESDDEEYNIWMNYYDINLRKGQRTWEIKNSEN